VGNRNQSRVLFFVIVTKLGILVTVCYGLGVLLMHQKLLMTGHFSRNAYKIVMCSGSFIKESYWYCQIQESEIDNSLYFLVWLMLL